MKHQQSKRWAIKGLVSCDVCGGAEASLPTDCPGIIMPTIIANLVQAGELDYRGERWQRPDGGGLSVGDSMKRHPEAYRRSAS